MTSNTWEIGEERFLYGTPPGEYVHHALSLCVADVDEFFAKYWLKGPAIFRQVSKSHFCEAMPLVEVEELLNFRGIRADQLRVVVEGRALDRTHFSRWGEFAHSPVQGIVQPARVFAALADGATIVLDDVNKYSRPAMILCQDISRSLRCTAQASVYVTPPGRRGLSPHTDQEHVLVLQLLGRKHWAVGAPESAGAVDVILEQGDALYVPAHTLHVAESMPDSVSLHLTVGLTVPTRTELLQALVARYGRRLTLLGGAQADSSGVADDLGLLRCTAEDLLTFTHGLIDDELRQYVSSESLAASGRLGVTLEEAGMLTTIDGGTLLQLDPAAVVVARRISDSSAELNFGSTRLAIPVAAALQMLTLDTAAFKLESVLTTKAEQAARTIARMLVAEGVARCVEMADG